MGFVLWAWVGQLGFVVSKHLRETIALVLVIVGIMLVCCRILNASVQLLSHQMITMMIQQKHQEDLAIQLTMKITELFLSNEDLEF